MVDEMNYRTKQPPRPTGDGDQQTAGIGLAGLIGSGVPVKRGLGWILGLAFALEACQLAGPMLAKIVVDRVVRSHDQTLLVPLAIIFSAIAVIQALLSLARTQSLILFGEQLNAAWLTNLFSRLVSLPMSFFEARPVGQVAAKFWSVSYMQRVLTTSFVEGALDGLMAIFGLVLILFLAPWSAAAGCGVVVAYAFFRWLHMPRQLNADKQRTEFSIVQQSTLWETIAGMQSVKLGLHQELRRRRWLLGVQGMFDGDRQYQQSGASVRAAQTLLFVLERVIVVVIAGTAVQAGQLSLGAMVALLAYNELFMQRTAALVDKWCEYLLLDVHRKRISELLLASAERDAHAGSSIEISEGNASVVLEGLSIGYDEVRPLATNIDVRIGAGECVVIMGPSGCGKTTLLRTLLGLSPELGGAVRVAGLDLRELRRSSLYRRLATVLREDRIFAGTVAENVALGDEPPDLTRVQECCAIVDLHHEIAALPHAYDTHVKDDGAILSAGQRQRILLARAFYRRPAVLVLDEATSNLDPKRERMVLDYLNQMRATRIVVTHREAHLSIADHAYEFKNGTVVQCKQDNVTVAAGTATVRRLQTAARARRPLRAHQRDQLEAHASRPSCTGSGTSAQAEELLDETTDVSKPGSGPAGVHRAVIRSPNMEDARIGTERGDAGARFKREVLFRDGNRCVFCAAPAAEVHQLYAKELWEDGGFFLENGASVCVAHLRACRSTEISVESVASAIGIGAPVLPEHLYSVQRYDTWGNPILDDGRRARGELFDLPSVQAELATAGRLEGFTHWSRYPRTYALPWSETVGEGDRQMWSADAFLGERVVATEKMDGENISLYRDFLHSRSVRESSHPTRRWLNDYWIARREQIPLGWRVCGEYLFARHTVGYDDLDSFFLGFAVWNDRNECLSWDDTMEFFSEREITPVRTIFDGAYEEGVARSIWKTAGSETAEGYVLRVARPFLQRDFRKCVGKFVRSGYSQSYPLRATAAHAMQVNRVRGENPRTPEYHATRPTDETG